MKHIYITLIAILFTANMYADEPDKDLHNKCIYPSVMLMSTSPCPSIQGIGSGVIVKSVKQDDKWHNFVLTVAHNIYETPEHECKQLNADIPVEVKRGYYYEIHIGVYENWSFLKEMKSFPCEIICNDDASDVAMIKFVTDKEMPTAEINFNPEVYIGSDVCRVGCGLSEPFRIDFGKITALPGSAGIKIVKDTYRISAPTIQGDSGGPVYEDNKLIGLAKAIASIPSGPISRPTPICHMVYVIPISEFLKQEEIQKILGIDKPRGK